MASRFVGTTKGSALHGTCGFGVVEVQVRRNLVMLAAQSTTLIKPAIPAAASRWPMFVFTEPTSSGRSAARPAKTAPSARTSIGSPSEVPVPCAST